MKLLLAVDDSKGSAEAIKQISALFAPQTTEIKILHVLSPTLYSTPPQMARAYVPELEELAKSVSFEVEHFAKKLRASGFAVETLIETGDVRSTIIEFAVDWGADLIVVGAHEHRGLVRFLLGSVAESVVRDAGCSVLVIRPATTKLKPEHADREHASVANK